MDGNKAREGKEMGWAGAGEVGSAGPGQASGQGLGAAGDKKTEMNRQHFKHAKSKQEKGCEREREREKYIYI
jgi:hypothetical protein